jgi:hypothetical protein
MRASWGVVLAGAGWLGGCGPLVVLEGDSDTDDPPSDGSTSDTPGTTAPPPGTTAPPPSSTTTVGPMTAGSDDATTDEPETTSSNFFGGNDASGPTQECDTFLQDCPPGEKCMPWAYDGGDFWNATRCSPIADNPDAPGEPCTVEGSGTSGIDSCELGAMCWGVDPKTNQGTCVAFCVGSPERPACEDANAMCVMASDGILALCIPNCDPLQQDCPAGAACYPVDDSFICAPDASGEVGAPGDDCEFINVCDPGSFCVDASLVPECTGAGCCTHFCDVTDAMPPCLPGQGCTPWYEDGMAPPGFENVGACALPS